MLQQPATAPKSGRSRFSKALPAVPGIDATVALPPPPQYLPALPEPSREPLSLHANSPLPSIPPSTPLDLPSFASGLPSGPAMSIPRKPIRKPVAPAPPAELPRPPSPSDSLSSLLSAYSRSSGESLVRMSDGSASMRESDATTSPSYQVPAAGPVTTTTSSDPRPPQQVVRKPVGANSRPPSPPSKDEQLQFLPPLPLPPSQAPSTDIARPSSPQPQIWRRRSRSSSRGLADLKLNHSHGSTALTQLTAARTAQATPSTETLKALPRTPQPAGKSLPGRNIRPTPSAEPTPIPPPKDSDAGGEAGSKSDQTQRLAANRPPTPEYNKGDVKSPIIDTFVSPISPASSPEPSAPPKAPSRPIGLPVSPLPQRQQAAVSNAQAAPAAQKSLNVPTPELHAAKSVPDLRSKTPSPANEPLPNGPSSGNLSMDQGRSVSDMHPNHFRDSGESVGSRARSSSARPGQRRPMEQSRSLPPESDPRLVYSESQGFLYKGRDGTLYPEMKELREPDPRAFEFPAAQEQAPPADTIFKAPPLKDTHRNCFQKHKTMNRRPNRHYPLTCQTCEKPDMEDRWVCSFCHLRICEPCLRILNEHQRDVNHLTKAITHDTTITLSSSQRPGSALGLVPS